MRFNDESWQWLTFWAAPYTAHGMKSEILAQENVFISSRKKTCQQSSLSLEAWLSHEIETIAQL